MSILDSLPSVIKKQIDMSDVKEIEVKQENEKPFILACSRNLKPEELDLLKSYGKVLVFHESFRNIPLSSHKFNYAIFDLHQKVHRDTLCKEDLTNYNVVCVIGVLDKHDDFVEDLDAVNCIHTFPDQQAFPKEFNRLLLTKKIRKPSMLKTVWRYICFLKDGL
jgi:hypothetical protein